MFGARASGGGLREEGSNLSNKASVPAGHHAVSVSDSNQKKRKSETKRKVETQGRRKDDWAEEVEGVCQTERCPTGFNACVWEL